MLDKKYEQMIGVIDQGTSSSRFVVFSAVTGEVIAKHQIEIGREHPQSGWVQQSAVDIYQSTLNCMNNVATILRSLKVPIKNIAAIGITNQRETSIAWDSHTGEPLCPAIVWSDSRTSDLVDRFIDKTPKKDKNTFQKKTGLAIHSYFSALKIRWMLDNIPAVKEANEDGRLKVGTVDCWLIYKLTGGASGGKHLTDVTNASRTNLFNIQKCKWDPELCEFIGINPSILPTVISSAQAYGHVKDPDCRLKGVVMGGILGDQQAALVGQTWDPNPDPDSPRPHVKVTYGTGAFLLWDIGEEPSFSSRGLLTTIAYQMGPKAKVHYALEGAVAYSGATMDWLRYKLELYTDHATGDELAKKALLEQHGPIQKAKSGQLANLKTLDACYLVPAFSGLFCPYWREDARGVIAGLNEKCTRGDLIAAGYRASAYQTQEVLEAARETNDGTKRKPPRVISVDGGLTKSSVLMQSLADITGSTIIRPNKSDVMTALGAAVAAAMAVGIDPTDLVSIRKHEGGGEKENTFRPVVSPRTRHLWMKGYQNAVKRSFNWQSDANKATSGRDGVED
ncbi:Glycerol kinase [Taenia solium]|eukprot:TsM_001115400 transcript=TsM_001115400 gene=TsM_001115400